MTTENVLFVMHKDTPVNISECYSCCHGKRTTQAEITQNQAIPHFTAGVTCQPHGPSYHPSDLLHIWPHPDVRLSFLPGHPAAHAAGPEIHYPRSKWMGGPAFLPDCLILCELSHTLTCPEPKAHSTFIYFYVPAQHSYLRCPNCPHNPPPVSLRQVRPGATFMLSRIPGYRHWDVILRWTLIICWNIVSSCPSTPLCQPTTFSLFGATVNWMLNWSPQHMDNILTSEPKSGYSWWCGHVVSFVGKIQKDGLELH